MVAFGKCILMIQVVLRCFGRYIDPHFLLLLTLQICMMSGCHRLCHVLNRVPPFVLARSSVTCPIDNTPVRFGRFRAIIFGPRSMIIAVFLKKLRRLGLNFRDLMPNVEAACNFLETEC